MNSDVGRFLHLYQSLQHLLPRLPPNQRFNQRCSEYTKIYDSVDKLLLWIQKHATCFFNSEISKIQTPSKYKDTKVNSLCLNLYSLLRWLQRHKRQPLKEISVNNKHQEQNIPNEINLKGNPHHNTKGKMNSYA